MIIILQNNIDMKTKEQIIAFVATELENGDSIVIATLGNGGSGLTLLKRQLFLLA